MTVLAFSRRLGSLDDKNLGPTLFNLRATLLPRRVFASIDIERPRTNRTLCGRKSLGSANGTDFAALAPVPPASLS